MSTEEAIKELRKLGGLDVINMSVDNNGATYHSVQHKYRNKIVVPLVAVTENIQLLTNKGDRYIVFADNVTKKVKSIEPRHICELESLINEIYHIDAWKFMKRWYNLHTGFDSAHFLIIEVEE